MGRIPGEQVLVVEDEGRQLVEAVSHDRALSDPLQCSLHGAQTRVHGVVARGLRRRLHDASDRVELRRAVPTSLQRGTDDVDAHDQDGSGHQPLDAESASGQEHEHAHQRSAHSGHAGAHDERQPHDAQEGQPKSESTDAALHDEAEREHHRQRECHRCDVRLDGQADGAPALGPSGLAEDVDLRVPGDLCNGHETGGSRRRRRRRSSPPAPTRRCRGRGGTPTARRRTRTRR